MPIGTIQQSDNLNTQSTVLTNSSVMVVSVVYGEWRWQPCQNMLNSVLTPICLLVSLNAELLVVVVVVGCVQGSWSQVSTFSCYSHCLPLTQNASKGYENNFQKPVLRYRLSMFCQNCVNCSSIRTGIPPPVYSATPRTRVKGPGIRTHTGAGDTVWQPILNLYNWVLVVDK